MSVQNKVRVDVTDENEGGQKQCGSSSEDRLMPAEIDYL